jgi:uncharacterized protein YkwD
VSSKNVRQSCLALCHSIRLFCLIGLALALGLVLLASGGQGPARADGPVATPPGLAIEPDAPPVRALGAADRQAWEWEVVRLVNQERASWGIPPLKRNGALDAAAYGHSQDMGVNDFFSHTGSNGSSLSERLQAAGYTNRYWSGENIAAGHDSPAAVMAAWMKSDGHRANILRLEFREIGVGYYYDAGDTYPGPSWGYEHYWTQDFGSRYDVYPVIINSEAYSTTSRSVQLYVYGPSGAQQMRFSNNGTNWSTWETYSTAKTWTLVEGSTGARTVYAEVKKDAQTYQASDDIHYVAADPLLSIEPTAVTLLSEQGSGVCHPAAPVVQVSNAGGGVLNWNASESSDWFNIAKSANTITVTCISSVVKSYSISERAGAITVTAVGAPNSPQSVTVTLIVAQEIHSIHLPLAAHHYSSP